LACANAGKGNAVDATTAPRPSRKCLRVALIVALR
jgi:hypothetical protein